MANPSLMRSMMRATFAQIEAVAVPVRPGDLPAPATTLPFVTISREAGAGGRLLGHRVVEILNEAQRSSPSWQCFDRELVEMVAQDHDISERLIDSIEVGRRTWLDELLYSGPESEFGIYKRVAQTVLALAQAGRAVIVGLGGVLITRKLRGGIHVRLVAPIEQRIENVARDEKIRPAAAAQRIREIDSNRAHFYRRHWNVSAPQPEAFTVTFNTALADSETMAQALATMIAKTPT